MRRSPIFPLAAAVAFLVTASAAAETPADFQRLFETAARQEVPGFSEIGRASCRERVYGCV